MKSLVVLLVVCAMASAADRHGKVNVVENAVNNNGQGQIFPDGAFYRPTNPAAGGPQQPDISPAWVQQPNNDYRGKHFDDPRLRGGK